MRVYTESDKAKIKEWGRLEEERKQLFEKTPKFFALTLDDYEKEKAEYEEKYPGEDVVSIGYGGFMGKNFYRESRKNIQELVDQQKQLYNTCDAVLYDVLKRNFWNYETIYASDFNDVIECVFHMSEEEFQNVASERETRIFNEAYKDYRKEVFKEI